MFAGDPEGGLQVHVQQEDAAGGGVQDAQQQQATAFG